MSIDGEKERQFSITFSESIFPKLLLSFFASVVELGFNVFMAEKFAFPRTDLMVELESERVRCFSIARGSFRLIIPMPG